MVCCHIKLLQCHVISVGYYKCFNRFISLLSWCVKIFVLLAQVSLCFEGCRTGSYGPSTLITHFSVGQFSIWTKAEDLLGK